MSMTDLKAFGERAVIGARKLPAAPALWVDDCLALFIDLGRNMGDSVSPSAEDTLVV